jgi:hypothetical protein
MSQHLHQLTAAQELGLQAIRNRFRDTLAREITRAMRTAKDGHLLLNLPEVESFLDAAYLQGRHDQAS